MSDPRWNDPREYDARDPEDQWPRVCDPRDRDDHDPRDGLMRELDLPRADERELVVDRDRVYELDGEDSRALAAVGAFRVVPEHDLGLPHDTLDNLHDQRLIDLVDLGDSDRGLTLTTEGRDLLDSHSLERDREPSQTFYAGVSRSREIDHDSNLYATSRVHGQTGGPRIRASHRARPRPTWTPVPSPPQAALRSDWPSRQSQSSSSHDRPHGRTGDDPRRGLGRSSPLVVEFRSR
jgi:hypothetical protein